MKLRNKIFISHSSSDVELVEKFVNSVLKLGLGIEAKRIFCSSLEGHGIKGGKYIPDALKSEMRNSCIALLIISNDYKKSEVCLNEIGASWVSLQEDKVIPLITDDVSFNEIGFLNLNKYSLKISSKKDIIKLCDENKHILCGNNINYQLLDKHIDVFISQLNIVVEKDSNDVIDFKEVTDYKLCWDLCLYPFGTISQQQFPEYSDELIHSLKREEIDSLLLKLSNLNFPQHLLWFSYAGGDMWFTKLKQLKNGNWALGPFELDIEEMWVNSSNSYYDEFILIKTRALPPFKIDSTGKESFSAGVTEEGIIVSENEWGNRHYKLNNKIHQIEGAKGGFYKRFDKGQYLFIATKFHNVVHNHQLTKIFCLKMNKLKRSVRSNELEQFMNSLVMHSTVSNYL